MATQLEIANTALTRIGASQITTLGEGSAEDDALTLVWDISRRAALQAYHWAFALVKEVLVLNEGLTTAETDTLGAEWCFVYDQPGAAGIFLRGLYILPYDGHVDFTEFGAKIYTNAEDAIMKYIGDVTDPTLFDPAFVDAFAWRLASDLAPPINGDLDQQSAMLTMFERQLPKAKITHAQKSRNPAPMGQRIIESRR